MLFSLLVDTEHSISQILIPDEQGYLLCLIPKAGMTKYHNLGAYNRNVFSHSSGGLESKIKVWAGPCCLLNSRGKAFLASSSFWWWLADHGLWLHDLSLPLWPQGILPVCLFSPIVSSPVIVD